ncbi:type VII secretion system-associated protein [Actinopolyspora halophila]|uniref:type VII secretion system-associated protein n=1 Tax=Actinopolyspora halophila TaxID=1850 RepID=UPI00035C297B|nr:type VII secretion system-associated protein [Actinopolyspora halophila]
MSSATPIPAVTDGMRQQAQDNPGKRVYVVDPEFDANGSVPGWGVRGAFPVSEDGTILESDYTPNPNYRPGPKVSGFPEPQNAIERALELAATGYGSDGDLLAKLTADDAEVQVVVDHNEPDHIAVFPGTDDRPIIAAYTSTDRASQDVTVIPIAVASLSTVLNDADLMINPKSPPTVTLPGHDITRALHKQ